MSRVSVHIVTYNALIFLDPLFISLAHQTYQDFSLLVVDNASTDGTVGHCTNRWPTISLVRNKDNRGYARAHNQAINFTKSEYVVALNADIILHERFLEELACVMDAHTRLGSASGKLLRALGDPREIGKDTLSKIIDSTGIVGDKKRFYRDRGAGEEDRGQYDGECAIIGSSGAAGMYRREALESIAYGREYFDELFDSYKEDVDCALRLRHAGWASRFVPRARAYHYRRVGGDRRFAVEALSRIASRPFRIVLLSYRNHIYTLIKNESIRTCWRDLLRIGAWELGKMIFLLCTKPLVVFRAWRDIVLHWRELTEKRREIFNNAKVKSDTECHPEPACPEPR